MLASFAGISFISVTMSLLAIIYTLYFCRPVKCNWKMRVPPKWMFSSWHMDVCTKCYSNSSNRCQEILLNVCLLLALEEKVKSIHGVEIFPVWPKIIGLTDWLSDRVMLPFWEPRMAEKPQPGKIWAKTVFLSPTHILFVSKGIQSIRECSCPWTKWVPPNQPFLTPTHIVRTERAPNHVWPRRRPKSECHPTRR